MKTWWMNWFDANPLQTQCDNHIVGWMRWWTTANMSELLNDAQTEYDSTASGYVIKAIWRKQLIAISFTEINICIRIKALQIAQQCWHTASSTRWKHYDISQISKYEFFCLHLNNIPTLKWNNFHQMCYEIYLNRVSSSHKTTYLICFNCSFASISSQTFCNMTRVLAQCPCSVFSIFVLMVGITGSVCIFAFGIK